MAKVKIHAATIGTIVEQRIIIKSKLQHGVVDPKSTFAKTYSSNGAKRISDCIHLIPTDNNHDMQLWAIAYVQRIDTDLEKRGRWAELPYILDILDASGCFDIDRDISHD